jgi:glucokinase
MVVDASGGGLCTCGNRGCLMGSASGLALPGTARRVAGRLAAAGRAAELPAACQDYDDLDGEILGAACEDNELCREVVDDFSRYIGIGLYNIFQILNPRLVVLGGGLLNLPDFFFEDASRICYEMAGSMMLERMEIRRGTLGAQAGILGAAALFRP